MRNSSNINQFINAKREKSSNNGKEGELLRPILVAFWRIENTQFPAVLPSVLTTSSYDRNIQFVVYVVTMVQLDGRGKLSRAMRAIG